MSQFDRRALFQTTGLLLGSSLLFRPEALGAAATTPARARLNFNENPLGPPRSAREALAKAWDEANRYQPAGVPELAKLVAEKWGVPADHVLVTQGSSEGLSASAMAFASGGEVVGAAPTYDRLLTYAQQAGASVVRVPLDATLTHDLPAMEAAVTAFTRLVFVCNPNNPTGTLLGADALEAFSRRVAPRAPVFIDEAYFEYIDVPGYRSMMPLVTEGLDVVVSRTTSKIHGMAGMRVGFLVARPDILKRIERCTQGFPNALAVRAAMAAIQDTAAQAAVRKLNASAKELMTKAFDSLGRRWVPSSGNMLFFHTGRPIAEVAKAFAERGVDVARPFPPLLDWCRVSTGTLPETERFVAAAKAIFS